MAFGRIVELDVGVNNNLGIRISGLHFNFEIERSVEQESNYGRFNIYNAKKETREKALIKDNNIVLRAGYRDENNLGMIFFGLIQQSTSKYDDTNYITEVYATDFGNNQTNIKKTIVNFNYNAGTTIASILQNIATIMSVPIIGLNNVSGILLNNGFVFYGTLIQLIRQIQKKLLAYNVGFYFDLGEMVIYNIETPSEFDIVNISPQSGLIGEVEEIIDDEDDGVKRISFTSLLNPKLKPNTVVRVKSNKITGGFIVKKIIHRGGIIGTEEFITEVEALA
jgi:hypothetical protein